MCIPAIDSTAEKCQNGLLAKGLVKPSLSTRVLFRLEEEKRICLRKY